VEFPTGKNPDDAIMVGLCNLSLFNSILDPGQCPSIHAVTRYVDPH